MSDIIKEKTTEVIAMDMDSNFRRMNFNGYVPVETLYELIIVGFGYPLFIMLGREFVNINKETFTAVWKDEMFLEKTGWRNDLIPGCWAWHFNSGYRNYELRPEMLSFQGDFNAQKRRGGNR